MKRAGLALLLWCAACADEAATPRAAPASTTQTSALRAIAREELARVEAEVGPLETPPPASEDLREHVSGLLDTIAGSDVAMKRLGRQELRELGSGVVPLLAERLDDPAERPEHAQIAAEMLGEIDSRLAAETLLARIEAMRTRPDPASWVRAHCAWRLGDGTQDWVVPRLILHLRYETDHETVAWIARTLAHFGNFSGLDALYVIWRTGRSQPVIDLAAKTLSELASKHGFADSDALLLAWNQGDPDGRLKVTPYSAMHRREAWRLIAGFSEWQLRGVDDARFTLSRETREVTPLLAQALVDENRYVRTHSAQTLERLGPRALAAGPALVEALRDPEIASQVAETLGAIGFVAAESELIALLGADHTLDLRTSAARALGRLRRPSSAAALERWTGEDVALDLRIAAGCARVRCSPDDAPRGLLDVLAKQLDGGEVDSSGPEVALFEWLAHHANTRASDFLPTLERWNALAGENPPQRVSARAKLFRELLKAK